MGIEINDNNVRLSNDITRNITILIIVACVVIDSVLVYLGSSQSNFFEEFLHLILEDLRYLALFVVPILGVIYLLATERRFIELDESGIFCSSFQGAKDVKFLWSQVDHIEHDPKWVRFHFNDRDQRLVLYTSNFICPMILNK